MGHSKNLTRADGTLRGGSASTATEIEPLLDEEQVAKILGWTVKALQRRRWKGLPPAYVKISETVRYEPQVIRDLIAAGRKAIPTT